MLVVAPPRRGSSLPFLGVAVTALGATLAGLAAAFGLGWGPHGLLLPGAFSLLLAISALLTWRFGLPGRPWASAWCASSILGLAAALAAAFVSPLGHLLLPAVAVASVVGLLARSTDLPRGAEPDLWGWLFVSPAVGLLLVWHFAPALYALYLSFFDRVTFLTSAKYTGLENYAAMLHDALFWKSLGNSAWFVIGTVPASILLATLVAILLNEQVRAIGVWRTIYFLPYITALTAAAAVWKWIYNPDFGILNALIGRPGLQWLDNPNGIFAVLVGPLGIQPPGLLQGPSVALFAIMVMSVWHSMGYSVVILLAGLQGIPKEYYEAASLDGVNWWQRTRYITWPLLTPTTFFLTITGLISAFQVFTQILVMTPTGGVLNDTTTIVKYLYDKGFRDSNFSYASALAFGLFVIVVAASLVQNNVLARRVTYDI